MVLKSPAKYVLLRLVRRFLPEEIVRAMLRRGVVIKPGLETEAPQEAVALYAEMLADRGITLEGKSVLVFGYGGNFAVAVGLLERGARMVVLSDKYAVPDERRNRGLLPQYSQYLQDVNGTVLPNPEHITLLDGDILEVDRLDAVDIVLSNSVYEHLGAGIVSAITTKLAALTEAEGVHLHSVDLRDHYFTYPFEMLTFAPKTWERWLNPTSNLNRMRLPDYKRVFEDCFGQVELFDLVMDYENFERCRDRIQPEFLSGSPEIDAVTRVKIFAAGPKKSA